MKCKPNIIEIFTDGASKGNPGPGGYAAILKFNDTIKKIFGAFRFTTNNRMELTAIIKALEAIKFKNFETVVYSDSKYIVNSINNGWIFNWSKNNWNKANPDLWKKFFSLYKEFQNIKFIWVKGHNGHVYNEECDRLAVKAAESKNFLIDEFYEKSQSKNNN